MMHPVWITVPILIWALHFTLAYGSTSLACARAMANLVPWAITAASVLGGVAALGCLRYAVNRRGSFPAWMTAALAVVTLIAIVYETMGAYTLPACR